jgi:hypothetical protein
MSSATLSFPEGASTDSSTYIIKQPSYSVIQVKIFAHEVLQNMEYKKTAAHQHALSIIQ